MARRMRAQNPVKRIKRNVVERITRQKPPENSENGRIRIIGPIESLLIVSEIGECHNGIHKEVTPVVFVRIPDIGLEVVRREAEQLGEGIGEDSEINRLCDEWHFDDVTDPSDKSLGWGEFGLARTSGIHQPGVSTAIVDGRNWTAN
jgi:hypothetical protein